MITFSCFLYSTPSLSLVNDFFYRSIQIRGGRSRHRYPGGNLQLSAGEAKGPARGGSVDIAAGDGTSETGGIGGSVSITAGDAFGDGDFDDGGDLTMLGGSANGGIGGSITLRTGSSTEKDSGAIGKLNFLDCSDCLPLSSHNISVALCKRSHCHY